MINQTASKLITVKSEIPQKVNNYTLIKEEYKSNYYSIFEAKSQYTDEIVSIKVYSKEVLQRSVVELSFINNEVSILKLLEHKNIIKIYELIESNTHIFIITEKYPPEDLYNFILKNKKINENDSLFIFSQIVDAMKYMHEMNICHRDIKPENIYIDPKTKKIKICNFIYSCYYMSDERYLTEDLGTPSFACPEIHKGSHYKPEQADVWSCGILLYVMIFGYLPFNSENESKNEELIIAGKYMISEKIDEYLNELFKNTIQIEPNLRWSFNEIINSKWLTKNKSHISPIIGGINYFNIKYPLDEEILNVCEQLGLNKKQLKKDLAEYKYNPSTGIYRQLIKKLYKEGINSVGDLESEDFKNYIDDASNYLLDSEIQKKKDGYMSKEAKRVSAVKAQQDNLMEQMENTLKGLENAANDYNNYKKDKIESEAKERAEREIKEKEEKEREKNIENNKGIKKEITNDNNIKTEKEGQIHVENEDGKTIKINEEKHNQKEKSSSSKDTFKRLRSEFLDENGDKSSPGISRNNEIELDKISGNTYYNKQRKSVMFVMTSTFKEVNYGNMGKLNKSERINKRGRRMTMLNTHMPIRMLDYINNNSNREKELTLMRKNPNVLKLSDKNLNKKIVKKQNTIKEENDEEKDNESSESSESELKENELIDKEKKEEEKENMKEEGKESESKEKIEGKEGENIEERESENKEKIKIVEKRVEEEGEDAKKIKENKEDRGNENKVENIININDKKTNEREMDKSDGKKKDILMHIENKEEKVIENNKLKNEVKENKETKNKGILKNNNELNSQKSQQENLRKEPHIQFKDPKVSTRDSAIFKEIEQAVKNIKERKSTTIEDASKILTQEQLDMQHAYDEERLFQSEQVKRMKKKLKLKRRSKTMHIKEEEDFRHLMSKDKQNEIVGELNKGDQGESTENKGLEKKGEDERNNDSVKKEVVIVENKEEELTKISLENKEAIENSQNPSKPKEINDENIALKEELSPQKEVHNEPKLEIEEKTIQETGLNKDELKKEEDKVKEIEIKNTNDENDINNVNGNDVNDQNSTNKNNELMVIGNEEINNDNDDKDSNYMNENNNNGGRDNNDKNNIIESNISVEPQLETLENKITNNTKVKSDIVSNSIVENNDNNNEIIIEKVNEDGKSSSSVGMVPENSIETISEINEGIKLLNDKITSEEEPKSVPLLHNLEDESNNRTEKEEPKSVPIQNNIVSEDKEEEQQSELKIDNLNGQQEKERGKENFESQSIPILYNLNDGQEKERAQSIILSEDKPENNDWDEHEINDNQENDMNINVIGVGDTQKKDIELDICTKQKKEDGRNDGKKYKEKVEIIVRKNDISSQINVKTKTESTRKLSSKKEESSKNMEEKNEVKLYNPFNFNDAKSKETKEEIKPYKNKEQNKKRTRDIYSDIVNKMLNDNLRKELKIRGEKAVIRKFIPTKKANNFPISLYMNKKSDYDTIVSVNSYRDKTGHNKQSNSSNNKNFVNYYKSERKVEGKSKIKNLRKIQPKKNINNSIDFDYIAHFRKMNQNNNSNYFHNEFSFNTHRNTRESSKQKKTIHNTSLNKSQIVNSGSTTKRANYSITKGPKFARIKVSEFVNMNIKKKLKFNPKTNRMPVSVYKRVYIY